MPKPSKPGIVAEATSWRDVILVCQKCGKKLDGGFGPDGEESLARVLKRALRATGRRSTTRVMETKCMGLCPKGAVAVLPATAPGTILRIAAGTDSATILASLPMPA